MSEVPRLYSQVEDVLESKGSDALRVASFLRMGSWIGGDRDGNPFVTDEVMAHALAKHCATIMDFYFEELHSLGRELSQSVRLIEVSPALEALAAQSLDESEHRRDELYRRALIGIYARLSETSRVIDQHLPERRALGSAQAYSDPAEFAVDLAVIAESLDANGGARIGRGRLRALRRLEEIELRREYDNLLIERADLEDLLENHDRQWDRIVKQLREVKKTFGKGAEGGARRTKFAEASEVEDVPLEAMIDKEPVTVVCSQMGWIRALTAHIDLNRELKFKDGDGPLHLFHAETTDRLLAFGSNGRFYTLSASSLPGGRGMGEPLRLMVDLPNEAEIVALFIHTPGQKLLVASSAGDGFVVPEDEIVGQTRAGKQALNVKGEVRAAVCRPVEGDHVAAVGENRKMLIFPVSDLPVMSRGKGVRLQKFKDGGLADARTFSSADGLSWLDPAGRTRTVADLQEWQGARASAGRMAPRGFPQDNRFT